MRIAQVTPVYPPHTGGIGSVARAYSEALQASGETVEVFHKDNVRGIRFGNAAFAPVLFWRLRQFDVIHLHYPFYGSACFVALASFVWRIPLVVTYHMKTKASGWLGLVFRLHRIIIEPFILRCAKTVFVSSFDYAQSIGFTHPRLEELPFWVDTERFSFRPPTTDHRPPTFLFVGALDPAHYFKGVDVLLKAFAQLASKDWNLLIVGDGSLRKMYEDQANEFQIADRVQFSGRVSDKDLPDVYRSADVHVLPSIDRSEAFGLVTLEAAASGLPSIVSDLPGVRTLVEHGHTGFVVAPKSVSELGEKLRYFIDHLNDAKQMGTAARMRVEERYRKERILERLLQTYQG